MSPPNQSEPDTFEKEEQEFNYAQELEKEKRESQKQKSPPTDALRADPQRFTRNFLKNQPSEKQPDKNQAPELQSPEEEEETSSRLDQIKRIARQGLKQEAKQMAKKAVKKAVLTTLRAIGHAIWSFLVATFPWSLLVILGIIFLILLIFGLSALFGYIRENPCEFLKIAGQATGNIILKGLGVVCIID